MVVVLLLLGAGIQRGGFYFLVFSSIFWSCAYVLSLGYCIVAERLGVIDIF
jgi:hypothetical protein